MFNLGSGNKPNQTPDLSGWVRNPRPWPHLTWNIHKSTLITDSSVLSRASKCQNSSGLLGICAGHPFGKWGEWERRERRDSDACMKNSWETIIHSSSSGMQPLCYYGHGFQPHWRSCCSWVITDEHHLTEKHLLNFSPLTSATYK